MKKLFLSLLSVFLVATTTISVYAAPQNIQNVPIIEVTTQEDYEQVVAELEANKARVEALWNLALEESKQEVNQLLENNSTSSLLRAYTVGSKTYSHKTPYGLWADLGFSVTYESATNSDGVNIFGTVYSINAYGNSSSTTVSVNHSQYTRIDSLRTLAVNYSCLVGVKYSTGSIEYYTYSYYVEFYASGGGWVVH